MKTIFYIWAFAYFFTQVGNLFGATPLPPRGYTPTPSDRVVAMTLLGEARGEGYAGLYAVATVIQKRMANRGMTAQQVCLQRKQFSCWNTNDVNKKKLLHLLNTHPQRHNAMWLARSIGKLNTSYTKEADHYCTTKTNPYWAKGKTPVRTIGNHKFYKLR